MADGKFAFCRLVSMLAIKWVKVSPRSSAFSRKPFQYTSSRFRLVPHEAATGAASARISLWSPDLQPHPLHICALTAEDILFEHSFKATGADCYSYRDGAAFSAVAPRKRPAWLTVRAPE
jgi:hypothetical protein